MIANLPYKPSGGKVAAGVVLAVIMGALTPLITVLQISMLAPVILLSGLFMVFLFCFAGRLPAWLFLAVQLGATAALLDTTFMWMFLVAGSLPAIITLRWIVLKKPFFEQMKLSIVFYGIGLVAALCIAFSVYGGNMVGQLMDALRDQFKRMPDDMFTPFVDAVNSAQLGSGMGIKAITVSDYRAQMMGVLSLMGEAYEQTLPGALLTGALLSGILSVLWGNWLCARHGLATNASYIPPTRWFLPPQVTIGLLLMWLAVIILRETGYASGAAVYTAVYSIVNVAFIIQALCTIDRALYRRGASNRRRRVMMAFGAIFSLILRLFGIAMFAMGAFSALTGPHGVFQAMRDRNNDNRPDHDDSDE